MEDYVDDAEPVKKEQFIEEDDLDASFMKGYADDEKMDECAECGSAVNDEKKVSQEIEGEEYVFCSDVCLNEFKESIGD
ncbi:TA0938 family protein [Candidatus Woesearchaeota archaeon]|jgi:hypothetical protein|nr:TA0938 family protein [Candidatus Woesearchaeota archaeon]MBT5342095.1 TA0938 family protein [Candidatus Woesearchaeota archaeon]MBT6773954.1 TA0938 family protein [Candidatus Woesearchaeota archaeon]